MVEYVFLEDIQKETWGPEENKNENYFILVFIIWEILIIEEDDPLLFNLTDNLAERNRYE